MRPDPFGLSVVVPFFDERASDIEAFFEALLPVLASLTPDYEVIAVDDGSTQETPGALARIREGNPKVKLVVLSRNYGHQIALTAGLDHAGGDAVVIMDGDGQDPPAVINEMIAHWREGFDVVYGRRERREGESIFKRGAARLFYRLFRILGDSEIPMDVGDFRLMDRVVVDALKTFPERNRFLRGLVSWMGFRQRAVSFVRSPRAGGEPKYSLAKLIALAANGLFSFSRMPLRLVTYLGLASSLAAFAYMSWIVARGLFFRESDVMFGWYALLSAVLFMGGIQLTCLGVIGEYVGRIYEEVKARPLYLVRERRGLPHSAPTSVVTRSAEPESDSSTPSEPPREPAPAAAEEPIQPTQSG